MRKELPYFTIDNSYGGNQNWFSDVMMKMGGCAAVTACDLCIYLGLFKGKYNLYPYDINELRQEDYIKFSNIMKPYLRPRMSGINTLQLFIDGFEKYLSDMNESQLKITQFPGSNSQISAIEVVKDMIDNKNAIPYLQLKHMNKKLKDFVWHWFLIVGYEEIDNNFFIKVATYGNYYWISFNELWESGYDEKGGMIILDVMSINKDL